MILALLIGCESLSLSVPEGPLSGVVPITLIGPEQPMELFADGVSIGVGKGPEFTAEWNTALVDDGTHVLRGESGDLIALETAEVLASFGDSTPPEIALIAPQSGGVKLPFRVEWRIEEEFELASVQLSDGDVVLATLLNTPPWEVEIDELVSGDHTLFVYAEDVAGNTAQASVVIQVR